MELEVLKELEEINRRYHSGEMKIRKIEKSECRANPGKFRALIVKEEEFFQIEDDALSADNASTILFFWWLRTFDCQGRMLIFNDQGEQVV